MNNYPEQWAQLKTAWEQGRNPQALLFVGALDKALTDFITHYTQLVFCKNHEACGQCINCTMAARKEHPDIHWIVSEKSGGPIKIDQIRALQDYAYLTPQKSNHRLIIIESADRMNGAAANALLKILEEPAAHILFLLVAQQISTVLPTVLSRCQHMRFVAATDFSNLFKQAQLYEQDSNQAQIMHQSEVIMDNLIAVIEKKEHPCVVAAKWQQYEFDGLLWFLYLLYAQLQLIQSQQTHFTGVEERRVQRLVSLINPLVVFSQIDKINTIKRKLSHNLNVNHTLALEDLLFDL